LQVLLDPYYRTFDGFAVLVEKDWCAFGHMFARRGDPKTSEYSPVFLQWVECVWQVLRQFPSAFEFTEGFLLAVVDGYLSGWSTTSLGDSEREREILRARFNGGGAAGGQQQQQQQPPRLWDLVDRDACSNPAYREQPPAAEGGGVPVVVPLRPSFAPQAIRLWAGLFLRRNPLAARE